MTSEPRASVSITPSDVGKRVSLQYFTADGDKQEAVGVFERAERTGDGVVLHIRRKDDTVIAIPLHRVRFGKVVPPARPRR